MTRPSEHDATRDAGTYDGESSHTHDENEPPAAVTQIDPEGLNSMD